MYKKWPMITLNGDAEKEKNVVGDAAVGKTTLLILYTENRIPVDFVPTMFDNFTTPIEVNKQLVELDLWDIAREADHNRLRSLTYPDTDCFLVCFSVVSESSFQNVLSKWVPEVRHMCPETNIQLVGMKSDLRDDPEILDMNTGDIKIITQEEAEEMAKRIGATKYIECSSFTSVNVTAVFEEAIRGVLEYEIDKEGNRIIPERPAGGMAMKNAASGRVTETP
jgi:Ras-related C3 botulinum toxin substrate 1